MQTPSAILLLSCEEVVLDLDAPWFWYRCLRNVPADDDAWQEEEGSAVFASPVSSRKLSFRIVSEAVVDAFGGPCGRCEVRETLACQSGPSAG